MRIVAVFYANSDGVLLIQCGFMERGFGQGNPRKDLVNPDRYRGRCLRGDGKATGVERRREAKRQDSCGRVG